ncbi:MAG TPA: hypothetical protein VER39_08930 [Nocardioidaceae bacterium]|nr:hypothetical protein [Nocardioidaceae bacterium]
MNRALQGVAWLVAALTCLVALVCVAVEVPAPSHPRAPLDPEAGSGGLLLVAVHCLVAAAFAGLGALVVSRRPRNAVGWLLVLIGVSFAAIAVSNQVYLRSFLDDGSAPAVGLAVMWVGTWAYLPAFVSAIVFLPLLFPTGRPLSSRWAALAWFAVLCGTLTFLGDAFASGPLGGTPAVENPLGSDLHVLAMAGRIGSAGLFPAALAAIVSLVLRYRRSSGVERQQLLWLAAAASLLPLAFGSSLLVGDYAWPLMLLSLLVVAGGVAVAMLRYRLYDIDVVVNRTLVYFALTVTLAASYVGVVLFLQLVLRPLTESSDVAVAASTLVVAALFGPARRSIQRLVDRRFYRRRYDARRTVAEFTGRLRQQVDLETLGADLTAVVGETVQPEHVSIWLRPPQPAAGTAVTITERSLGRPEAEGRP